MDVVAPGSAIYLIVAMVAAVIVVGWQLRRRRRVSRSAAERLLAHSGVLTYRSDIRGRVLSVSTGADSVTGLATDRLPSALSDALAMVRRPCDVESRSYRVSFAPPHGFALTLEVFEQPHRSFGRLIGYDGVARDVSESQQYLDSIAASSHDWESAMEFFPNPLYITDRQRRVMRANRAFLDMLGQERSKIIGRDAHDLLHPAGLSIDLLACRPDLALGDSDEVLEVGQLKNPFAVPLEVRTRVIRDRHGEAMGTLVGMHDLSRERQVAAELQRAASVFDWAHEGIVITDADGRVVRANFAFTGISGYPEDTLRERTLFEVLSTGDDDAQERAVFDALRATGQWQGEAHYRNAEGEVFPVWHRISAQYDPDGYITNYIHLLADITERKLSEAQMYRLAHYDALTELPNRLLLTDRLNHALERARRSGEMVALLFVDLDRFKAINDSFGHQVGDLLLRHVAARLRAVVREEDTVARLAGDEFVVLLEGVVSRDAVDEIAGKLLDAIAMPAELGGRMITVQGSIGISIAPNDGDTVDLLLKRADMAMYRSKSSGRNTYYYHDGASPPSG